jgi:DNA-binding transcriptional LysR family regulator
MGHGGMATDQQQESAMSERGIHRYFRHGTLPQLRLFEASARLGSFTRAAHELHMSQPTASVRMKKLSATVGVALFEQVGKRVYLTDAGRRLYESCQEVFRAFGSLEESLAGMRALESGRLRLAVSTTCMCFAPRLLGAFVALHPAVETSVGAHNRQALVERLARNEDDLYLFADAPDVKDVVAQELLPNPLVVLARDDHPLAAEKNIPFERLATEPFLIREQGSGARRIMLRLFREHGFAPRVRMELGTNEAIKEAILAGLGVAIMSRYTFGLDPESSRYVCLDIEGFPLENHWYLAYPAGKAISSVARAFLDFARTAAKGLVRGSLDATERRWHGSAARTGRLRRIAKGNREAQPLGGAQQRPRGAARSELEETQPELAITPPS